ncbi:MAG: hypothetical protein AB8H12_01845 [Lewinella sp.]
MRYLYPLFLSLFLTTFIEAQSNWQPATIVLTDGTERAGEIDDRRWNYDFDEVRFRNSLKEGTERISIAEMSSFKVNGRRYETADVRINASPRDPRHLLKQEERIEDQRSVALLILVEGSVSLFEYGDERGNAHFFIRRTGQTLEYLDYGRYLVTSDNDGRMSYNETSPYRARLISALSSCDRIRNDILQTRYRREALMDIFERYYNCGQERSGYWLTPEGGVWQFGPDLGMIKGNPTYGEIDNPVYPFSNLVSWNPAFGGHAKYRFSGRHGTVAVRLGVFYHNFNVSANAPDLEEEDPTANATFQYVYNERSLHFQFGPEIVLVRSRYPLFLETMVEYHRILDYQESRFLTRTQNGQTTADGVAYDFSRQGAFSLTTGVGIIAGKTRLSLRVSATRRKYPTYVLNLYRLGVVGSYDF